jgi:chaperone BCS1
MNSIHLFMEGLGQEASDALKEWINELLALEVKDSPEKTFRIYRWHNKYQYWQLQSVNDARSLNSVVLPAKTKQGLVADMTTFLSKKTKAWYKNFGIPYKRSYIFYGPPGTGKTSMIQALAGAYQRNVCFLQPNGQEFTDAAFKTCLQKLPAKSILVLEDIDALFHCRQSKNANCPLTFTGLLNI